MNTSTFTKTLTERSKDDFVFISYSQTNPDIRKRVAVLANHLTSHNINVIYDGGGTPAGANINALMQKICDPNCRYVLVVCDSTYQKKIAQNTGGVATEAEYLIGKINRSHDHILATSCIIPLLAEETVSATELIPYFLANNTYLTFFNTMPDTLANILDAVKDCVVPSKQTLAKSNADITHEADIAYAKADAAYTKEQYEAAERDIQRAFTLYESVSRKRSDTLEKYYHLAGLIYLRLEKDKDARDMYLKAIALQKKRKNKCYDALAIYYANLSLTYQVENIFSWEHFAELALTHALKGGVTDIDYYYSLYSSALYKVEKFSDAYAYALKAYEILANENRLETMNGFKYICNLAEISLSMAHGKKNSENFAHLKSAEHLITQALSLTSMLDINDLEYREFYLITVSVFKDLHKYYL